MPPADMNRQPQQAIGRRLTPHTAQSLGSELIYGCHFNDESYAEF
jgi:hypothetical protein